MSGRPVHVPMDFGCEERDCSPQEFPSHYRTAPDPGTLSERVCAALDEAGRADHYAMPGLVRGRVTLDRDDVKALLAGAETAARLAAVPARDDLAAKVEAWDQGYQSGWTDRHKYGNGDGKDLTPETVAPNPYRALLADPEPDQEQP